MHQTKKRQYQRLTKGISENIRADHYSKYWRRLRLIHLTQKIAQLENDAFAAFLQALISS